MKKLEQLQKKFKNKIKNVFKKNDKRVYITIDPKDLVETASYVFNDLDCRFVIVTGLDTRTEIELMYHFSDDSTGMIITLVCFTKGKDKPAVDSLTKVITGASWIEREIHELLGVDFKGHPDLKHLLLGDDWPKNNYPLRHDNEK